MNRDGEYLSGVIGITSCENQEKFNRSSYTRGSAYSGGNPRRRRISIAANLFASSNFSGTLAEFTTSRTSRDAEHRLRYMRDAFENVPLSRSLVASASYGFEQHPTNFAPSAFYLYTPNGPGPVGAYFAASYQLGDRLLGYLSRNESEALVVKTEGRRDCPGKQNQERKLFKEGHCSRRFQIHPHPAP